jgi:hypothetical protein
LMQVVGAARNWEGLIGEAQRVLRRSGALVVGHTLFPLDGVDARMKARLASILKRLGTGSYHLNTRADLQGRLDLLAATGIRMIAAAWDAERTPRGFLERQPTGARFSALPRAVKEEALQALGAWAAQEFGGLDAVSFERHEFELKIYRFGKGPAADMQEIDQDAPLTDPRPAARQRSHATRRQRGNARISPAARDPRHRCWNSRRQQLTSEETSN